MAESWVRLDNNNEAWVEKMSIPQYAHGNIHNHDEQRRRKLLLHKKELAKISHEMKVKNLSLVPLKIYWKKSMVKLEIALGRPKRKYDKRQAEIKKSVGEETATKRVWGQGPNLVSGRSVGQPPPNGYAVNHKKYASTGFSKDFANKIRA